MPVQGQVDPPNERPRRRSGGGGGDDGDARVMVNAEGTASSVWPQARGKLPRKAKEAVASVVQATTKDVIRGSVAAGPRKTREGGSIAPDQSSLNIPVPEPKLDKGKQRVRDNDAPTSNVANASVSSAPVHPQTRKVRNIEIPGSDVKGKKRARDVKDERQAPQEKVVVSMVEGEPQRRSPRKMKVAVAPVSSALSGVSRSSDGPGPSRRHDIALEKAGDQHKVPETVPVTSDLWHTENAIPKLDRKKKPIIKHSSAPPVRVVQEPARPGAPPDAGNDPKSQNHLQEDDATGASTADTLSAPAIVGATQRNLPRRVKEAVSSYAPNGPPRGPVKTQNAEKKPEKGKQRVQDDLPPPNAPIAPDPTEPVSTALDTRSNPKGKKRLREDQSDHAALGGKTTPSTGRSLPRKAKEHIAPPPSALISAHNSERKGQIGSASAPIAKRKAIEASRTIADKATPNRNGSQKNVHKTDKAKQRVQADDAAPTPASTLSNPKGKKRAREDEGAGQVSPDQTAATTTGSPSARKKEYFPRKAKDHVALAAPNKLPNVGLGSDAHNSARTTADNALDAQRTANEATPTTLDRAASNAHEAHSHAPKVDKGKQRMRDDKVSTSNTASTKNNPMNKKRSPEEDREASVAAKEQATMIQRKVLAKLKFRRTGTPASAPGAVASAVSDAPEPGINRETASTTAPSVPHETREASSTTPDGTISDLNAAQALTPKVDKGKQRMRNDTVNSPTIAIPGSSSKGRKRAREDNGSAPETPKKRGRKSLKGEIVDLALGLPSKAATSSRMSAKAATAQLEGVRTVKWKTLPPPAYAANNDAAAHAGASTDLRPRIWTEDHTELLAMMPEMTGATCVNGVSWRLYETPMVLLDARSATCFGVDRRGKNIRALELVTTRVFTCLAPTTAELEATKVISNGAPPCAFQEPLRPANRGPEPRRRAPRYKSPKPRNSSRLNAGAAAFPSNETPRITVQVAPQRLAGEPAFPPFTMRLEPVPTASSEPVAPRERTPASTNEGVAPAPAHGVLSPSTRSRTPVLPELPAEKLTPAHAGCVKEFLKAVNDVLDGPRRDDSTPGANVVGKAQGSVEGMVDTVMQVADGWADHNPVPTMATFDAAMQRTDNAVHNWASGSSLRAQSDAAALMVEDTDDWEHIYEEGSSSARIDQYVGRASLVTDDLAQEGLYGIQHSPSPPPEMRITEMRSTLATSIGDATMYAQPPRDDRSQMLVHVPIGTGSLMDVSMDLEYPQQREDANHKEGLLGHAQIMRWPSTNGGLTQWSEYTSADPPMRRPYYREHTWIDQGSSSQSHAAAGEILRGGLPMPLAQISDVHLNSVSTGIDFQLHKPGEGFGDAKIGPQNLTFMADEGFDDMVLLNAEDTTPTIATVVPAVECIAEEHAKSSSHSAQYVPTRIPEELQIIVDAYLFGRPLTLLISNRCLQDHWALKLPEEYGYAMLGYFKILGVQEILASSTALSSGYVQGQVEWRFHLQWAPGGEEAILPSSKNFNLQYPWWDPPQAPSVKIEEPEEGEIIPEETIDPIQVEPEEPEDVIPTTARYRDARLRHHEYKFRHSPLSDLYHSVVPQHLLVPFGPMYLDSSFPRGWLCGFCGRLTFQAALRHRKCPSSFCKNTAPPVPPYAQDLFMLRDPQEQLPLSAPLDTYPKALMTTSFKQFDNGMQTFAYHIIENDVVFMKHIFTSNAPPLQDDASKLLCDIQINVPLRRPLAENSPYFFWAATSPPEVQAPTDTEWAHIPACMNTAKRLLIERVRTFGELAEGQLKITRLRILAWITAGSKKSGDVLQARTNSVVFCALGCTVVLVLYPRSLTGASVVDKNHGAEARPMVEADGGEEQNDGARGWISGNPEVEDVGEEVVASPKKGRPVAKAAKPSFTAMLMHGDILVLHGDEFEYSVKRDGTSLLLIASGDG